jgi:recombination protein U
MNRGKKFEEIFRECVEKVVGSAILRLHDQTTGYAGSKNPCDFIVYKAPYMYAIECKSVHGNRLPFVNITDYQWSELKKLGDVQGVIAGVVCWWIDKDVTLFLPIATLWALKYNGAKSVSYEIESDYEFLTYTIKGRKKRVFFEYDMQAFFNEIEHPVIDTIIHPV